MYLPTCRKWLSLCVSLGVVVLETGLQAAASAPYLECYSCRAYQYEDDFRSKLSHCESGKTGEIVQCPYSISVEENGEWETHRLYPSCTIVMQKAAGAITSYTRGCKYFTNCTDLDLCGEATEESGVCMSCCQSDLCNAAPSLVSLRPMWLCWTLAAILVVMALAR